MGQPMSDEYEPHLEMCDGEVTDMLIEDLLACIYAEVYETENFDEIYTKIVQSHVSAECPSLMASYAARDRLNAGAIHYLVMLRLDFTVISSASPEWPNGGFVFLPSATTAVSIHYPDGENASDYAPGKNINQAALASLIQLSRERSIAHYNQPELPLRTKYDA